MTASQLFPTDAPLPTAASPEAADALSASDSARLAGRFVAALKQALDGRRGEVMSAIPGQKRISTSLTAAADLAASAEEKPEGTDAAGESVGKPVTEKATSADIDSPPLPLGYSPASPPQELVPLASLPDPALAFQSCYFAPTLAAPSLPPPMPPTGGNAASGKVSQPVSEKGTGAHPHSPTSPPAHFRPSPPLTRVESRGSEPMPARPSHFTPPPSQDGAIDLLKLGMREIAVSESASQPVSEKATSADRHSPTPPVPHSPTPPLPHSPTLPPGHLRSSPAPGGDTPTVAPLDAEIAKGTTLTGLELPGTIETPEKVAVAAAAVRTVERETKTQPDAIKPLSGGGLAEPAALAPRAAELRGTTAAKSGLGMESLSHSEQTGAGAAAGRSETDDLSSAAGKLSLDQGESTLLNSRNLVATDWQTGRPVGSSDGSVPDLTGAGRAEAAATVERITSLVVREAALIKQYTTDSMSLLLRPDANTELVLHLIQRDGQVEAFIRCERGDFGQLSALWPQLQESLAGQKVRLAPLQESSLNHPNPQQQRSGGFDLSQSGQHSHRQTAPGEESLAERPPSAPHEPAPDQPASWRGSPGTRLTPSRPGWETWA